MTKKIGSLGGRDDVRLPGELPEVGRWQPRDSMYLEGEDIGRPGEFPTRGTFLLAEELGTGEELYLGITEGLDRMLAEAMEDEGLAVEELTVEVETAEKAGNEDTSPWRYTASIVPAEQVGPPE